MASPDEEEYYGHTPLPENTELTKQLRPNNPVMFLYMLELVFLATGHPYAYRIPETPQKKTPIATTLVPPKVVGLFDQLAGGRVQLVYKKALEAIENPKKSHHLRCMVENITLVVFSLHWYTKASLMPL